jgi:NitT/TauT family transport system substrate-binding protein
MKIRSVIFAGIIAIVAISVAVAIYDTDTRDENKIRVAYFPNIGHVVPIVGIENGIFSKGLGNDTKIETKLFDSGPQVIESVFAKSIDIAYVGPGPTINGFLKSEKLAVKILAGAASGGASLVIHPNSQITSVEDFPSKRIAAPQIGNTQDVSLRHYLLEHGLKPAEKGGSVVVFNIPNPDIYTLFVKGEIDAAWVPEPWATILVEELGGKRLFYEEELWPENQFASVLLIGSESVNWINSNSKESELIFNQFLEKTFGQSLPEKIVSESLSNLEITSDAINESIYIFAERADELGYLGRDGYDLEGIFYDAKEDKL